MSSSEDIVPESVCAEASSTTRIAATLPESIEMERAFTDSQDRDGKRDEGKVISNSAAGDQASNTQIHRGAVKSEHQLGTSSNKQEQEEAASKSSKESRNPITGFGLRGDGVGGIKPLKQKAREGGNPLTGEGYKPGENKFLGRTNGEKNSRGMPPQDTMGPW